MTITTSGLDLAESVFQAHGIDEDGNAVRIPTIPRRDTDMITRIVPI